MNETLRMVDGRPVLRIERRLAHPPEKVWRALTEPEQLSKWYPFRTKEIELRPGAEIHFSDDHGTNMTAVITEVDPPRVFAFSEHAPPEMTRESDDLVRFELKPEDQGCLLIFTHVFDDRPAAATYAAGWTGCLDKLEFVVEGKPADVSPDMAALHARYVREFGLDAGSEEATPEGWTVRFDRQLMLQPVDAVWKALSGGSAGALEVGAEAPSAFAPAEVRTGPITEVQEAAVLKWSPAGSGDVVRWELSNGPGGARITVTHTGPVATAGQRTTVLSAWQAHLDQLIDRLRNS